LYILDEPTTGLHFHDIKNLLEVLHKLVAKGNTVLVIEHNMDVIKTADWVIDLGPEGGEGGGRLVAAGQPEHLAQLETPTGYAIRQALYPHKAEKVAATLASRPYQRLSKKQREQQVIQDITVIGAEQNNLKHLTVTIPREKITICTGPSGSGKSSLAFETIYAEGQRRYIESLSPYARQFVKQMPKPKVGHVSGLSPAIAIEQKAHAGNPRSTVGTMTEVYDYLRILFARLGIAHCPETGEIIQAISKEHVVDRILCYPPGEKIHVLAPLELGKQERFEELILRLKRQGFTRIRLNGEFYQLEQEGEENFIPFGRKRKNELYLVIDRLKVDPSIKTRLYEAVEHAASIGEGKLTIMREDKDVPFNLDFAVESTGKSYPEITPQTFAFNTQEGMCPDCLGLGYQYGANLMHNPEILEHSVMGLMRYLWQDNFNQASFAYLELVLDEIGMDPYTPLSEFPIDNIQLLMQGMPEDQWLTTSSGLRIRWQGINNVLAKAGKSARSNLKEALIPLLQEQTCLSCQGARINPLARHVTIQDLAIQDLCRLPIEQALHFVQQLQLDKQEFKLLEEVQTQLINRLGFLCEVGLHYLSLDRRAPTLSGGESQRIRLARQLGSGLTGVLYVLDEPTIGLHPRDNARLNAALKKLKELENTLLLVEHDPLTIATADYILDFGPQSGEHGGHITAKGTLKQIMRSPHSLTGAYLSGKKQIPIPVERRPSTKGKLSIKNASKNNLKQINVDIPIGVLTCLTGVSGSGKSTLLQQILLPALERRFTSDSVVIDEATISGLSKFDKVISIDQDPIGLTNRSDVGTYVDVLTRIRDFFTSLPAARMKGLQPKHFSYNHRKGMCTACWGLGYRRVEMHFLPPVKVLCEECHGLRLNPVSLEITYKDKNLGQYLDTTVDEARILFENHPRITRILDTLIAVGLGYVKLGQETASLSGGEAQRLKLSRELAKRSTGRTLYLLDEPTTGLHSEDIQKLLKVLHRLVDKGNTMIMIEHQLDMIKNADYLIDLGPEAGEKGGYVVCSGTPEQVAEFEQSWTGRYLKEIMTLH
jgi:excinuclease ABC subunit A